MKRVFFDMEFTGLHQRTTPVSLAMFGASSSFEWEFNDFDPAQVDEWFAENVMPHLGKGCPTGTREECAVALRAWLEKEAGGDKLEMWSDCLAYDWVLFCELFGGARKLPECVYYIPQDICTLFWEAGIDPDINREEFVEVEDRVGLKHSAMWDAKMIFLCFRKLEEIVSPRKAGESKPACSRCGWDEFWCDRECCCDRDRRPGLCMHRQCFNRIACRLCDGKRN